MMRPVQIALCLLLWVLPQAHAAEMRDDPKGFEGLPWGTRLADQPRFVLVDPGDPIQGFELRDQPTQFGGVPVGTVRFYTVDGKLARVLIRYRGKQTHERILALLESRYGPTDHRPDEMIRGLNQQHTWRGPESQIDLTYEDMGERGHLFIESRVLAPRFLDDIGE